jgi:hypothetical protein
VNLGQARKTDYAPAGPDIIDGQQETGVHSKAFTESEGGCCIGGLATKRQATNSVAQVIRWDRCAQGQNGHTQWEAQQHLHRSTSDLGHAQSSRLGCDWLPASCCWEATIMHPCAQSWFHADKGRGEFHNREFRLFPQQNSHQLGLSHTTYTCAFKPGCLTSHNWLHTPDCKV